MLWPLALGLARSLARGGGCRGSWLCAPHPSASLASRAVLRGKQASCLLPLKQHIWDNLGQRGHPSPSPWQRLRLKRPLIKTPRSPTLSPGAIVSGCVGMLALSSWRLQKVSFEVNPSKQEPSNPGMVLWKTPSSSVALGAARGSAGVLAGAPARTAAPAGRGMRGLQLGPMSRAEALPRGRGACVGARRPASGASALGPQQGLECLVCLGINRNGGSLVVQPHFLEAFALDSAQHRGSARGAF